LIQNSNQVFLSTKETELSAENLKLSEALSRCRSELQDFKAKFETAATPTLESENIRLVGEIEVLEEYIIFLSSYMNVFVLII
jgi:hypothetical protein